MTDDRLREAAQAVTPEDIETLRRLAFDGPDYTYFTLAEMRGVLAALDAERAATDLTPLAKAVAEYDDAMEFGGGYEDMVRASGPVWAAVRTLIREGGPS
jgi:hypothetical protein